MSKHEIKRCARCNGAFECKANNPVHCDCAEVVLSRELAERLGETYDDCLCVRCLEAIQADPEAITAGG
jgi:hypothetical protein